MGESLDGGVDAGGFQSFLGGKGGVDGGEAGAEHGFSCAGWAEEDEVVVSGGGDGEGAFSDFLSADFGEVDFVDAFVDLDVVAVGDDGLEIELAVEEADEFGDFADGVDGDAGTTAASGAFSAGRRTPSMWRSLASMAMERAPLIGRTRPSRASSPATRNFLWRSVLMALWTRRMPRATGSSRALPSFLRSAGARLMTM